MRCVVTMRPPGLIAGERGAARIILQPAWREQPWSHAETRRRREARRLSLRLCVSASLREAPFSSVRARLVVVDLRALELPGVVEVADLGLGVELVDLPA